MYKHEVIVNTRFTETANEAYNQNLFTGNSFTSFLNIYCSHISEINSYVVSRNISNFLHVNNTFKTSSTYQWSPTAGPLSSGQKSE